MNAHDRKNLEYIMQLTSAELYDWAMSMPMDDIIYAQELISARSKELYASVLMNDPDVSDLDDCKKVICKFTLCPLQ